MVTIKQDPLILGGGTVLSVKVYIYNILKEPKLTICISYAFSVTVPTMIITSQRPTCTILIESKRFVSHHGNSRVVVFGRETVAAMYDDYCSSRRIVVIIITDNAS